MQFRVAVLIMLAVFLLAGVREGIAGYVCFQHGGHDHDSHAFAGSGDNHSPGDSPADAHEAHHGAHAEANDDASTSHGESDPCSCVGDCQTGESGARPNPEPSPSATITLTASAGANPAFSPLPGAPEFFLPYSNGPPSLG
ncbi:MAG: hypothetical protein GEU90_05205 [Gemmatimonas sp.]|nr:hypothetical protein [Gemmatimonas sp.]